MKSALITTFALWVAFSAALPQPIQSDSNLEKRYYLIKYRNDETTDHPGKRDLSDVEKRYYLIKYRNEDPTHPPEKRDLSDVE